MFIYTDIIIFSRQEKEVFMSKEKFKKISYETVKKNTTLANFAKAEEQQQ